MAFDFLNLDARTRELMVEEIEHDSSNGKLYLSPRLNYQGRGRWKDVLKSAAWAQNEVWLSEQIQRLSLLAEREFRRSKSGEFIEAKIPVTAHITLAEGEFNRFYIRALCRRALSDQSILIIYRAKAVQSARVESEVLVGSDIDPDKLLKDLRGSTGIDAAFGIPPGPNSGLSVRLC